jgi:hypothetical protein
MAYVAAPSGELKIDVDSSKHPLLSRRHSIGSPELSRTVTVVAAPDRRALAKR